MNAEPIYVLYAGGCCQYRLTPTPGGAVHVDHWLIDSTSPGGPHMRRDETFRPLAFPDWKSAWLRVATLLGLHNW